MIFPLSGGIFEAFPHRTIVRFWRDSPRELLCLLWSSSSGFGHAVCSVAAVSCDFSHTGFAPGYHPRASTLPATGRTRVRPPVTGLFPAQVAKPGSRRHSRVVGHLCRAGCSGCPDAGWISGWAAAHRCATPSRLDRDLPGSCRNPCCCRISSSRPFAGCLCRRLRRASTPGRLPLLRRTGATRSARSVLVVRSHLDGFLRALVSRLLHLVPALTPLRFHPALPPTASGFPETPDVGDATLSRSVVSHPSKNPPPVCLRTRDANLEPAVPRHRGLCPLAVFTTSRRCSGPRGQRVAVCRCRLS